MKRDGESLQEAVKPISLRSRKSLHIGSWNVRTMYEIGKTAQIAKEMQRYRLHILGISETRWIRSGQKRLRTGELLIYSGHEEEESHTEGVALMINTVAQKTLRGWEAHGSRIIMASFTTKKKFNINIVQIYAPTNNAEDEQKESFYNRLQNVMEKLPSKDMNIIMGDANAKVGKENTGYEEIMGKHGLGEINDNGERFLDMCGLNNMVIGGTVFPHKRIHKATWISPDGITENQIDHFYISRKFRRSLKDVRVMRGADVGSDHHLIFAKLRLSLKHYRRDSTEKRLKFQVSVLKDTQKREDFKLALNNRFQPLQGLPEYENINANWNLVRETFTNACQEVIGLKKPAHKEWITQASLEYIDQRREKKEAVNNSKTRAEKALAQDAYRIAAKMAKKSLQKDKDTFLEETAEKAEKAAANGHLRIVYQTTYLLTGRHSKPDVPVKDELGQTIFGKEAQLKRWEEHFKTLLNRQPPENPPDILPARRDLPIDCDPPTRNEILDAIKSLNSGKAAGPDNIPPEALKADTPTTVKMLFDLFRKIWTEEKFPEEWKVGHLIKLPKKGDLSKCNNYRGITLLSIPAKVFSRIILERMKYKVDELLRDQQAGFRKNRSCTDQIATLRIILEQSVEWNSPLLVNFVDFEKAFDSLDRETLWKIMRHYGIPTKIVNLVRNMYDGTSCKVLHEGQFTDSFKIKTGVRQGCLLSPFLFIISVDWIMREVTAGKRNGIQWTLWTHLDDLDFADDLALLSHTHSQMQEKTEELDGASKRLGLHMHSGKTKVLKVNSGSDIPITLADRPLEEVESFTYLGSVIDMHGGTAADIRARVAKARAAFNQLEKIWKARKISPHTKIRIFNSNVKAVLLYGSETWATTKTNCKKLQTFINGCLRRILRVQWMDKVRNEELWERTNQLPIEEEIGRRRWRWIGHTLRKPSSSTTRHALKWNPQGKRNRGRPRISWRRCLDEDVKRSDYSWNELAKLSQDRSEWKSLVRGLYPGRGDGQ